MYCAIVRNFSQVDESPFQVSEKPSSHNGGLLIPLGLTQPRHCVEYLKYHIPLTHMGLLRQNPKMVGNTQCFTKEIHGFEASFIPCQWDSQRKHVPATAVLSDQLWILPQKLSASEKREIHVKGFLRQFSFHTSGLLKKHNPEHAGFFEESMYPSRAYTPHRLQSFEASMGKQLTSGDAEARNTPAKPPSTTGTPTGVPRSKQTAPPPMTTGCQELLPSLWESSFRSQINLHATTVGSSSLWDLHNPATAGSIRNPHPTPYVGWCDSPRALKRARLGTVQGYLAHKKPPPRRTLQ